MICIFTDRTFFKTPFSLIETKMEIKIAPERHFDTGKEQQIAPLKV